MQILKKKVFDVNTKACLFEFLSSAAQEKVKNILFPNYP